MSRSWTGHAVLAGLLGAVGCAGPTPGMPHRIGLDSTETAESWTVVLSDIDGHVPSEVTELRPRDLGLPGDWTVLHEVLHGGKQEGVQQVTLDTGALRIVVLPTRGMSVYEVRCGELRLGWDSPSAEIVHPALIDLESRGGLGWLEGFNESMVRCGLEFAGHPGTDVMIDNVGQESTMELSLHGRIGNLPASRVELVVEKAAPHRLHLRGIVDERSFYGPKLRLETSLSVVPGEKTWRITDTVHNLGGAPQEFQLIYHANFGAPLLEEGAVAVLPARTLTPMNEHAATGLDTHAVYAGPTQGFVEQVYLIEPHANSEGETLALLHSADGRRGAMMRWSVHELPHLTQWKNTASRADGYVTGLEPGTGYPFNRRVERAAGRVPVLAPGESRRFELTFEALDAAEAVAAAKEEVEALGAGERTQVFREPPTMN